jgi:hypothetical protein
MDSYRRLFFPQYVLKTPKVEGDVECGSTVRTVDQNYQRKESSVTQDADRRMSEQNSEKSS